MRPDNQVYTLEFLQNGFTHPSLWLFYEDLFKVKHNLQAVLERALLLHDFKKALIVEKQLTFVDENLDRVQFIMDLKECDLFEFWGYAEVCLN